MKRKLSAGLTSTTIPIFIADTSSTTGAGLSGLTSGSGGLVCEYRRQGQSTWTAVTLSAGTLGTWSSGGFVADGALAGAYEVGVPDAALAAGARWVAIRLRGATNMLACLVEIELDVVNYQDSVRFGLTAIPNATAGAVGGLPLGVDASGRVDVLRINGTSQTARDLGAGVLLSPGTGAGQIILTAGNVTVGTNNDKTGYSLSGTQTFNVTGNRTGSLTGSVGSVTTVSDKTGYSLAATQTFNVTGNRTGSLTGNVSGSVGTLLGNVTLAATTHTGAIIPQVTTTVNLTNLPAIPNNWLTAAGIAAGALDGKGNWSTVSPDNATISAIAGYVDTEVAAIKVVTDKLNTALELFGSDYRFTIAALVNAPAGGGGGGASAAAIADAVADELVADHTVVGSLFDVISDILAKTNTIGSGTITVTSPLRAGGGLTLIRGDDYSDANGVPLTWTDTGSRWGSLIGSAISLVIQGQTFAGTVVDADTLKVQLTAAQTSGLSASSVTVPTFVYYVRQTNGAGKVTTLARGLVTINDPGIA
jgi:hypothetical protein